MLSAPLATLAKLFVLPSPAVNTAAQEEEVAEPEARVVVTPPAPAAHASPAPAPVAAAAAPHAFTPHAPAEAPIAAPAPSPVQPSFEDEISSQPSGRGMAQHRDDYDIEEDEDVEDDGEFLTHPVALEALQPLRGEDDWMRRAYEARQIRWGRLIGAVALVTGAAYLAVRAALPALAPAATPKAAIAPVPVAATTAGVAKPLSRGEASSLVTKWQRIKAAALGPQHAMDGLDGVLAGELLTQWQDRAVQLTSKGWHYTHDLQSCKVVEVVPGPVAGTALITAAMREGVTVHKGPDVDPQSFASEYQVVYHAVRGESGWVLTGAVIQAA